jgi:hypothetical protein
MVSSPLRQPPRPLAAGRLVSVPCLLLLALALSAGPANAYRCGSTGSARTPSAHVTKVDETDCTPPRLVDRKADPISFAFFVGIIVAVLLVPVALNKRRAFPSE